MTSISAFLRSVHLNIYRSVDKYLYYAVVYGEAVAIVTDLLLVKQTDLIALMVFLHGALQPFQDVFTFLSACRSVSPHLGTQACCEQECQEKHSPVTYDFAIQISASVWVECDCCFCDP